MDISERNAVEQLLISLPERRLFSYGESSGISETIADK